MTANRASAPVHVAGLAKLNHNALQKINAKYRTGYRFGEKDKDAVCDQIAMLMDDVGATPGKIAQKGYVAWTTVHHIINGKTRRPQNRTIEAILRAMGYTREIVKFKIGEIE